MWMMAAPPEHTSAPRSLRWPQILRWSLRLILAAFVAALIGAAGDIGLRAAPAGATFAWPFRVVGRTNVLIMGLDRTVSDQNPNVVLPISRTDTLIAASFDPATHRVYLLSIPRDTRAPIPGHGMDKINAAHAYGGAPLTVRAVENFLGVPFSYYIQLHVRGLVDLVDAVGGITVRIPADLNYDDNWDGLHIHLKRGNRRLGGQAAMEYTRFRHDALGDIGRIGRQQQVMNALLAELRQPRTLFRLPRVLAALRKDTDTNLDQTQLFALGLFGVRLPHSGIVLDTLPGRFEQGGAGYWLPEPSADRAAVARLFYGMDPTAFENTTVEVANATGVRDGLSDSLARLAALGVRVVRTTTAADAAETTVIVHRGDPGVARAVAALVGARRIASRADADPTAPALSIVVGSADPPPGR
jgi:polyisoprenyl-teichoic acid--peptidoglycan teichoic acid transferase